MLKLCCIFILDFEIIFAVCHNNLIYNSKKELYDIPASHHKKFRKLETNHLDIVLSFCFSAGIPITIMLEHG